MWRLPDKDWSQWSIEILQVDLKKKMLLFWFESIISNIKLTMTSHSYKELITLKTHGFPKNI